MGGWYQSTLWLLAMAIHCALSQLEECKLYKDDPCRCAMENGRGLDLTALRNVSSFLNPSFGFLWSPCGNIIDYPGTDCSAGTAMCLVDNTADTKLSLGTLSSVVFSVDKSKTTFTAYLNYSGGSDDRETVMLMVCSSVSLPGSLSKSPQQDPPSTYHFLLTSPAVCEVQVFEPESHLSIGSIIMISLAVILFLYFSIGIIYMRAAQDAEGLQVIPHSAFWCSLPGLIKDGVRFIISPCTGSGVDQSKYEQIN